MEQTEVNSKNWKSLIKPGKLDVQLSEDKTHAKIVAEPLEKGYGLTLGNSLRRILLSSIRGTAVTAIQIDGVLHEFTSIKGVREDVTDIVLNVKSLALKCSTDTSKKLIYPIYYNIFYSISVNFSSITLKAFLFALIITSIGGATLLISPNSYKATCISS